MDDAGEVRSGADQETFWGVRALRPPHMAALAALMQRLAPVQGCGG